MSLTMLLAAAVVAAPPTITTVLWAGHLQGEDGPLSRTAAVIADVFDVDSGVTLGRIDEPALLFTDGDFFLEIPVFVAGAGDPAAVASRSRVELVVDGVVFPPFVVAGAWPAVSAATFAVVAEQADDADVLGALVDPLTATALAEVGVSIAFANVVDVPADLLDGDDGLDLAPDSSFTFLGGVLSLAAERIPAARLTGIDAADLADDSVTTTHFVSSAVTTADIVPGSVPLSAIDVDSVTAPAIGSAGSRVEVFEVDVDNCSAPRGSLQTTNQCLAGTTPHTLPSVGFLVFR